MNKAYLDLIERVRDDYLKNHRKNSKIELTWCDQNGELCKEINLWTYWQGWKYAERQSKIKILLIGQDWGNPNESQDTGVIKNVKKMNEGIDVPYLHNCNMKSRDAQTDVNLIELFSSIGYEDIDVIRYPDLFFTNFNLGYRTENGSRDMTPEIMDADSSYILELIDILKPEKILCLGEAASRATIKLLFGEYPQYKTFNDYIDKAEILEYKGSDYNSNVYPLFHTGYYGVKLNRKGGIEQHKKDWERIIKGCK